MRMYLKHVLSLDSSYRNPAPMVIRRCTTAAVTFVKVIRGRWFVVASSDSDVSELSLWEIEDSSGCRIHARIYLPGRVIDGMVDDSKDTVKLAVTIGTL